MLTLETDMGLSNGFHDDSFETDEFHDFFIEISKDTDYLFLIHEQSMDYAYESGCETKTYYKGGKSVRFEPVKVWPEFSEGLLS